MEIQNHRKWAFFLLLTLFSLWFSGYAQREIQVFNGLLPPNSLDFGVYYTAGLVARSENTDRRLYAYSEVADPNDASRKIAVNPQAQPPEPDSTYGRFAKETGSEYQYLYPPFFSMTMIPLTYLSYEKAKILWHVLIFLFACASIVLTVKLLYQDYLTVALISFAAAAVMEFTHPMQNLLFGANITSVLLFLTAAGLYLHKKHPIFAAFFFAAAVFIKLTPIVVVPLMIIRKQWKWLAAFCCWSVLLLGISVWQLGWQNHQEFLTRVMPAMSDGAPNRENRSLSTALYAVKSGKFLTTSEMSSDEYRAPIEPLKLLFKVFAVITFIGLLAFFWYCCKTDSQIYTEMLVLLAWSIIFSPVSLRYNYLLAVAPIVFAWLHPLTKRASSSLLVLLSSATFMIFSILPNYGFVVSNLFLVELATFMVMPTGVILCICYLVMLSKLEAKTLAEPRAI